LVGTIFHFVTSLCAAVGRPFSVGRRLLYSGDECDR
jgi:hypothetical protein